MTRANRFARAMKSLSARYPGLLARYSGAVLVTISTLSAIAILCALTLHDLPDFTDPQAGFETRGTEIARRLTAWENLLDSVSHVGPLTTNPLEAKGMLSRSKRSDGNQRSSGRLKRKVPAREDIVLLDPPPVIAEPVFSGYIQRRIGWLCGEPMPDYAHVVFRSKTNQSLFSWESIISMCTVDSVRLRSQPQFKELCETKGPAHCCPGWSLGGYIGLLHKRSSCFGIKKSDVSETLELLKRCSPFYHSGELTADCLNNPRPCIRVPRECITHNAIFTILHYLTDHDFMSPENVMANNTHLRYVMSFLPVARSSATLEYFHALEATEEESEEGNIGDDRTEIVAMDLGLKETLFNEYLMADAVYMAVALLLISLAILAYTQSMFITVATLLAIVYALALAYFIYTFICGIKFFPFMNVLAAVIAIGVGADDTFILVKAWNSHSKMDPNLVSVEEQLESMVRTCLGHSALTMCVTSFTTAAAFFASFISSVTAIKCFSIFAGVAILCNLALMLSWTPAALVFYTKHCKGVCCGRPLSMVPPAASSKDLDTCSSSAAVATSNCVQALQAMANVPRVFFEKILPFAVIRPRFAWVTCLGSLVVASLMVVFYYPKLNLPDQEQFQLFKANHIFEKYDLVYKRFFGFEKDEQQDISYKMPLRFIWGIQPVDMGSHLNPSDKGQLIYDRDFDITSADSQKWMLRFCEQARKQPFYKPTLGPLLSNCFMETFKEWMERRCKDELTGKDRAPCCQASMFPYTTPIFEKCLLLAIGDLYATPTDFWRPGVAGPKFNITSNRVEAIIVEYDSNVTFSFSHADMKAFYTSVNEWFSTVIQTAPAPLRNGFFLSHLGFYDVQSSLLTDTLSAIGLAMGIAVIVIFACTLNFGLSFLAVLTISSTIFVSMAILVFLGWKLNILESVAITLAIGLSVDFTLHYGVMFKQAAATKARLVEGQPDKEACVVYSLANIGGPVTMAAFTTILPGLCLLPSKVLAYIQIGTFIIVLMSTSWVFATFFLQAFLRIIGPTTFTSDSIPEETCCGQRLKANKAQRETWQPKVILKESAPIEEAELENTQVDENPYPVQQLHEDSRKNEHTTMKTFASAESTITHVSGSNSSFVTTIAAQVNPPYTSSKTGMLRSSMSISDDVFKHRNLDKEDLLDGRVTLPIPRRNPIICQEDDVHLPEPQELDRSPSPGEATPSPPPHIHNNHEIESSAPPPEFDKPEHVVTNQLFETAIVHSDSPTIRADPVCSRRPVVDLNQKIRRSGSSGTVIELVPMQLQMEAIEIDLSTPVPSVVVPNHHKPIKSIIKNPLKASEEVGQPNYYYYADDNNPPPPPPHAYELQDNFIYTMTYNSPPAYTSEGPPVPMPRKFDVAPPYRDPPVVIAEHVAASRRRRRSRQKSLPMAANMDQEVNHHQESTMTTEEELICQVTSTARWNRSKSCHERSNSMKRSKRKLAPDEDLITVVTDEHTYRHTYRARTPPLPKPRTILSQSLGNMLVIDPDQLFLDAESTPGFESANIRQTLPRSRNHVDSVTPDIYYVDPRPSPRYHSYSRHPLSHSTETILYTDDRYDPNPILPNKTPDVPDIWLPMRSVKA